MHGNMNIKNVR